MKTRISLLASALVLGTPAILHAQDAASPKKAPATASTPVITTPAAAATESTNGGLESVFSTATLSNLGISSNLRVVSVMTNRLDLVQRQRVQMEGPVVAVIKRPSLVTVLQMFNPFAPAEFGGNAPLNGPGFSRAFADPNKTYPTAALISVGDRPARAGDNRKPVADH